MQISSLPQSSQLFLQHYSHPTSWETEMSLLSAQAARINSISTTAQKRGLFRRRELSFGSQLSGYYLLQTLRSFPKMLLSGTGALPPFIHEYCSPSDHEDPSVGPLVQSRNPVPLQEPLAICKSIMHMYFSKTSESASFVWRTIEMELNRLSTEVSS